MTKNELVWAGALEFERQHGERAAVFVAERIGLWPWRMIRAALSDGGRSRIAWMR